MTGPTDIEVEQAIEALRTNRWYIVADMMRALKRRAEAAEKQLEDYIEVEEANRDLVRRGDYWKAKAEAAEKALQTIAALPSVDGLTETERTQQELRLIEQARHIATAALEAKP